MIELIPGRYVSQWWFMCGDNSGFDVLVTLYRDQGATTWNLVWRFRYYDGTDRGPFDDEDQKRWYKATTEGDEQEVLRRVSVLVREFAAQAKLDIHAVPLRTDDPKAMLARLEKEPWMHVRHVEVDKAEGDKSCEG